MTKINPTGRRLRRASTLALALAVLAPSSSTGPASAQAPPIVRAITDTNPCDDFFTVGPDGRGTNRYQTVVQVDSTNPGICALEQTVLAEIAADRGLIFTPEVRAEILRYGRSEVRARLYTKIEEIGLTAAGDRTTVEQGALDWAVERLREFDLGIAQTAVDEYDRWEADKCSYQPPAPYTYNSGCNFLANLFSTPSPPLAGDFIKYAATIETESLGEIPDLAKLYDEFLIDLRSFRAAAAATGGAAALTAGTFTATANLWALLLPYKAALAAKTAAAKGAVAAAAATGFQAGIGLGVAAIVLIFAVVTTARIVQLVNEALVPVKLQENLDRATAITEADIDWTDGEQQLKLSLLMVAATSPDVLPPGTDSVVSATPPSDAPLFETTKGNSPPTLGATFEYLDEYARPNRAWIVDNWWVVQPLDGDEPVTMQSTLRYRDTRGGTSLAYIVDDRFMVDRVTEDDVTGCPNTTCELTNVLTYFMLDGANRTSATSTYRGVPPTITAPPVLPATATDGDEVILSVDATDPEGLALTYEWFVTRPALSGGEPIVVRYYKGSDRTHEFSGAGPYTITAVVTNATGAAATASTSITVESRPVDIEYETWTEFAFGSTTRSPFLEGSPDVDLWITTGPNSRVFVDWPFDGAGPVSLDTTGIASGQAIFRDHPVYNQGTIDVEVWVQDLTSPEPHTETARETITIDVANAAPNRPEVQIFNPATGEWQATSHEDRPQFTEGETVRARFRAADPGGDPMTYDYRWTHDRSPGQTLYLSTDRPSSGEWIEVSLPMDRATRPDSRFSDFSVAAVDDEGLRSLSGLAYFSVASAPPRITSTAFSVDDATNTATLQVVAADALTFASEVESITVDWGDGSPVEELEFGHYTFQSGSFQSIVPGSVAGIGTHRYASARSWPVTVTVTDDDGETATEQFQLRVYGIRPAFDGVVELDVGAENEPTTLGVAVVDGDSTPDDLTVTVDWGDGSPPTTASTDPLSPSPYEYFSTHVYESPGTYAVRVLATDQNFLTASYSGTITVGVPSVTIEQATGQSDPTSEPTVSFDVTFSEPVTGFDTDDVTLGGTAGGSTAAVSGSGSTYSVMVSGMTQTGTVTASILAAAARDADDIESAASTSADNSVSYIEPITISVPGGGTASDAPVVTADPGQNGAVVEYDVTSDGGVGTVAVTCDPPSGSLFLIGTTTVTCTATDTDQPGESTVSSFAVVVTDDEPPAFDAPGTVVNLDVAASSADGAVVEYATPTATDNSGSADVRCDPASGSTFPVGITTVTCVATDPAGLTATTSFDVSVSTLPDAPTPSTSPPTPSTTPGTTPSPTPSTTPSTTPTTTPSTTPATAPTTSPTTASPTSPLSGMLPLTGGNVWTALLAALALLMIGGFLVIAGRRPSLTRPQDRT